MKKSLQTIRLRRDSARSGFQISLEKDAIYGTAAQVGYWSRGKLSCIALDKPSFALALSAGAKVVNSRLKKNLGKSAIFYSLKRS